MKRFPLVIVVVTLFGLLVASEAFGCPNCKDGFSTSDPDAVNVARGYFYSILLMLAMPFTLAGTFAAYVWREMRKQQRSQSQDQPAP
ncbi:MAG: hypothetical protein O3A37_12935 [Planctomycetota bacterium]|jgi:heme/copper-type cytochrome/quinol oxidase subunit 2|nr:hypothetical protein [Planctomycetota bacterium]